MSWLSRNGRRHYNIIEWEDTVELCTTGKFSNKIPSPSYKYNNGILNEPIRIESKWDPDIQVHNIDTLDVAESLVKQSYNPLILNMANHLTPGGGVRSGAHAQEEHLFKTTNLFLTLTRSLYPIRDTEIIYSPKVHQVKNSDYVPLEQAIKYAVISVAALRNPRLNQYGQYDQLDQECMIEKIRMIFHIGALHKHDILVLGALGCGAFGNPPNEVALFFDELIKVYGGYFKGIIFAVKCGYRNPNCSIFRSILTPDAESSTSEEEDDWSTWRPSRIDLSESHLYEDYGDDDEDEDVSDDDGDEDGDGDERDWQWDDGEVINSVDEWLDLIKRH
jgi:uncharacterized protein (TIGR02452 family)